MTKRFRKIIALLICVTAVTACRLPFSTREILNNQITPIPNQTGQQSQDSPASSDINTFHINFNIDEKVVCSQEVKCDAPFVPKFSAYFRGVINTAKNGDLDGEGQIIITNAEKCQTLDPSNSSCVVNAVSDGSFKISGQMDGSQMSVTLSMIETPALQVIWTTKFPTGDIVQDFSTTYQEEMKQLFINAGIIEQEFMINPGNSAKSSAINFEGTYQFGGKRTVNGFGGLIIIPNDTVLPPAYQP